MQGTRAPAEIPGYQMQRFIGAGAYGEVWVAVDLNTQRRVAIKFYTHRGGLDWALLSREVEKLAFLSADRYVVQLLDVGWDATPPFYVMEYVEQGSLEDRLKRDGPMAVADAVEMFHEVAVGLMHAHARGVLHCDLKPANVLLDQDAKPRLADFGQSRLSHEQAPALGTLFYMAPEQADLNAVPDATWDVYALGALLHTMITGAPPFKTDDVLKKLDVAGGLEDRLLTYRNAIRHAPPLTEHRNAAGVDKPLAEIIDTCLQTDPKRRYPNVQAVLDDLHVREVRRQRWPLVVLGTIGPALLVTVVAFFAWQLIDTSISHFVTKQTESRLNETQGTARRVAERASNEMNHRFGAVERLAEDSSFRELFASFLANSELSVLRERLNDPEMGNPDRADEAARLRKQLTEHPLQQRLAARMKRVRGAVREPETASWFINDPHGLQAARHPISPTIGKNFGWRTYFTGEAADHPSSWRPGDDEHVQGTNISAPFLSHASGHWIVTISTPAFAEDQGEEDKRTFLGVVALTVELGAFDEFRDDSVGRNREEIGDDEVGNGDEVENGSERFDVLVDLREGENKGLILQHPLLDKLRQEGELPERLRKIRLTEGNLPDNDERRKNYRDPFAQDVDGREYDGKWFADIVPVRVFDRTTNHAENTGLFVIVQRSYDSAIGNSLVELRKSLITVSLLAIVLITLVVMMLWGYVVRRFNKTTAAGAARTKNGTGTSLMATETMATLPDVGQMRRESGSPSRTPPDSRADKPRQED